MTIERAVRVINFKVSQFFCLVTESLFPREPRAESFAKASSTHVKEYESNKAGLPVAIDG